MVQLPEHGDPAEAIPTPLLETVHCLGRALALENCLPEPAELQDVLLSPLSLCWDEPLSALRDFAADASQPWLPAVQALDQVLQR